MAQSESALQLVSGFGKAGESPVQRSGHAISVHAASATRPLWGHVQVLQPSAALNEVERQERLSEDVLRYLTIRVEELEEGPSAMMRKSDRDRDDRGDRGGRFGDRDRGGDRGGDRGERRPRRDDDAGETASVEE